MTFLALILKSLVRQPVRTGLTVLGISIGITTVVALGVIADGLRATAGELITAGGADFVVAQKGASDMTFSTVSEADVTALGQVPGVERASGMLLHVARVGDNPFFMLFGARAADLATAPPLREGHLFAADATDEIIIGDGAARELDLALGDTLTVDRVSFRVTGIYHTGGTWEDAGGYAPLAAVQKLAGKTNTVTGVFIKTVPTEDPRIIGERIEAQFPNLAAIVDASDYGEVDQGFRMIDAANLAISVLAVGIGAIGVMNTMVMSVFERTRQIGILRAVGWGGARVLRMVVGESLILCLIAALFGSALGAAAALGVAELPAVRTLLQPAFSVDVFVRGLVVAVLVALAGAAYPAYRAVRLSPMEALRYE